MSWPDWERDEYVSASRIKVWMDCCLQFWFEYVSDYEPTKPSGKYAELGTAVHQAIEYALEEGTGGFRNRAINLYHEFAEETDLESDDVNNGRQYVTKAADYLERRMEEDGITIEDVEAEIPYRIDELDQNVSAKIDIIANLPDGGAEIWDWKTGKSEEKEWVQACVYKAAFVARYGYEPECVRFVYVQKGKVNTHDPDQDDYKKLIRKVKEIHRGLKTEDFPANPGSSCHWCDYEFYCPESDVGYGTTEWARY